MRGELAQVLQAFRDGYRITATACDVVPIQIVRETLAKPPHRTWWIMQRAGVPNSDFRELLVPETWTCPDDH